MFIKSISLLATLTAASIVGVAAPTRAAPAATSMVLGGNGGLEGLTYDELEEHLENLQKLAAQLEEGIEYIVSTGGDPSQLQSNLRRTNARIQSVMALKDGIGIG